MDANLKIWGTMKPHLKVNKMASRKACTADQPFSLSTSMLRSVVKMAIA